MKTPFLSQFSILLELTESFRVFVVGSIISIYGLVLYELFPEYLFNPNFAIYYFVIPMLILGIVGIGLPRMWPKILDKIFKKQPSTKPQKPADADADDILNQIVTEDSSQQLVQQDTSGAMSDAEKSSTEPKFETSDKEIDELIASATGPTDKPDDIVGTDSQSLSQDGGIGEDKIRDLIDQKFEPVEKDLSSFKKDLNKIKEDMKVTKESVDTLTESFEGTLTDMKAFQAEISNPLNFMRKYFESIDLKSLQDPSLPLRQQEQDESVPTQHSLRDTQTLIVPSQPSTQQSTASGIPTDSPSVNKEVQELKKDDDPKNPMDSVMKPLFSGNLSVGKMMSIIELAGDMLKEQGEDCIDLLVEQCKLMGLKPEDESTIYNIIDMLKNSKMNVEDALIQLYKFSKIVGITDPEAERYYAKLMAGRKSSKSGKGE